eukprot:IDg7903t1
MKERQEKRRKVMLHNQQYKDCGFILGSNAEVERLFSLAGNVYSANRRSMTPQVFEAIVFLKYNRRFWDQDLVSQAVRHAKKEASNQRYESYLAEEELIDESRAISRITIGYSPAPSKTPRSISDVMYSASTQNLRLTGRSEGTSSLLWTSPTLELSCFRAILNGSPEIDRHSKELENRSCDLFGEGARNRNTVCQKNTKLICSTVAKDKVKQNAPSPLSSQVCSDRTSYLVITVVYLWEMPNLLRRRPRDRLHSYELGVNSDDANCLYLERLYYWSSGVTIFKCILILESGIG